MGCSIHDACLQARQMDWLDACIAIGEKLVTDVTEVWMLSPDVAILYVEFTLACAAGL